MFFLPVVANMDPSRKLLSHKLPSSLRRFSYSSASLLAVIPMRACALNIRGFDKEFEVVRPSTFMVDTERCCSGLVAISAISFLTIARPNEL
jgi:hypothetical protein